ncbi:hypothetical protein Rsub_03255 [Raphidocelis subcapitata]|uniref:Cation efflux protein transmembrane domain-containing protein n=1 Tax=Raphidocelis subcapitata TaxID=307507 RepID=A0A2V0NTX1_9CHLO|nr:hypothetical protein Rsub_03255 [Raphidocelis subcapitata]|eukprot:GBF90122.1 hypothetical protein Rsub_03255 [Raphidocelis subcapitata]
MAEPGAAGLEAPLLGSEDGGVKASRSDCRLQEKCFLSEGQASSRQQYSAVQRKLVTACILCFIFMVVEIVGGWFAHSIAIMSDAAHMLSDVSAFLVSIFAAWAATQPGTQLYSFGYHRAEILGALVSVLIIWLVTGALVVEAVQRTINPVRVDGKLMFIISVAGIVFNIFVALALGVHNHLGHSHSHGGGCGGGHGHSHSHDHKHEHEHEHEHEHGEGGAEAGTACGHSHSHSHKHSHEHGHSHKHSGSACSSSSGSSGHSHEHGDEPQQQRGPRPARGPDGSVVISVPAAACIGDAHVAECKCFIQQTGAREIEVRCELPVSAAAAQQQRPRSRSSGGGHGHGHDNINLRGAVLHVIGDLVQSAGVAVAGALIWAHQDDPRWYVADPICTFLFSVLVLWTTKNIVMDIIAVLMERAPLTVNPAQVSDAMSRVAGILDVHDLHVWNISTGIPVLTAHVHIGEDADPTQVLSALEVYVRHPGGESGSGSGGGSGDGEAAAEHGHGHGHDGEHEHGGSCGHGHSHPHSH